MEQSNTGNVREGVIMKNIFVEGIQGMGKSTLVNKLAYTIPGLKVCGEGDYSPVDLAWCTWMSKEQYEKVFSSQTTKDKGDTLEQLVVNLFNLCKQFEAKEYSSS